jgi:hypothetical protein
MFGGKVNGMHLPSLQFIYEGSLLSFCGPVKGEAWEMFSDLTIAKNRAREQTDEFPIWSDLREDIVASSGTWKAMSDAVTKAVYMLVSAYTPLPFVDLEDDIASDLLHCVNYDMQGGPEERLYPMLLEAYSLGGWPCGWSGNYPTGKLCVYWPSTPVIIPEPISAHDKRVTLQKKRLREQISRSA